MTEISPIKNCRTADSLNLDAEEWKQAKCEVRESLKCPVEWEKLSDTEDPKVRNCAVCNKSVHLVTNDEELGRALRQNQCIAWQIPDDIKDLHKALSFTLGRPELGYGPVTRKLLFR